jgi:hypothetical protein
MVYAMIERPEKRRIFREDDCFSGPDIEGKRKVSA